MFFAEILWYGKAGLEMSDKIRKFGPYVFLGAVFVMLIWLNVSYQLNWLDSDMAAEMRFSKLLAEEGARSRKSDGRYVAS